jgi:phytanoyl-CoA hydroxylase
VATSPTTLWLDDGIKAPTAHLYETSVVAQSVEGFGAITEEHIEFFHDHGYLSVENAFTQAEIDDALAGLLDLIDGANPDFKEIQFEAEARDRLATIPREEKQDLVRKLMSFAEYEPRLKALSAHPALLATVTRLIDAPPVLFQDMALLKPPMIGREKPWHQDNAFFNLAMDAPIVGVWIAIDEAMRENGCMHVIPGSHRHGPVPHFQRRDWQICDTDVALADVIAVPLKPGGLLFFHGLIHHGTPASTSPLRRRALQYHYKPADLGDIPEEERLAVFGSEGKDVTC